MEGQFLLVREYAKRYRISRQTAYTLLKNGEVPGAVRLGKQWRIPISEKDGRNGQRESTAT